MLSYSLFNSMTQPLIIQLSLIFLINSMATRRATEVTEIHTDITIVKSKKLIKHSKSRSHLEKKTNKKLSVITKETRQSNLRS